MAENPRIEELRRRVLADPASIAFAALAEEFRRVGRFEEAIETCRTGLQRHPAYLSARVTLGRALIETRDYEGAREQLETVLRSAPENLAAIRGIAQIDEHLSHSTEMDPHIADVMHTMHEESLRAAAERVSVVSAPPPVEPELELRGEPDRRSADLSLAPGQLCGARESGFRRRRSPPTRFPLAPEVEQEVSPAPQPEPPFSMSSGTGTASGAGAPVDVFASFAPASSGQAPAHDLSFNLSSAFSVPQKTDRPADAPVDFSMAPSTVEPVSEPSSSAFRILSSNPFSTVSSSPTPPSSPRSCPNRCSRPSPRSNPRTNRRSSRARSRSPRDSRASGAIPRRDSVTPRVMVQSAPETVAARLTRVRGAARTAGVDALDRDASAERAVPDRIHGLGRRGPRAAAYAACLSSISGM